MMFSTGNDKNKHSLLLPVWIICLLCLLIWRLYVFFTYSVRYLDMDQASMWCGTVLFAHGEFHEPCFFGQNYGTMLESLLAVPLYIMGWPLNYALPFVTLVLSVIPIIYCGIKAYRGRHYICAFLILLLFSWTGWQVDILCTLPRSLICGFPIAIMGTELINLHMKRKGTTFLGAFLLCYGFVMTETVIIFILIYTAYYVYIWLVEEKSVSIIEVICGYVAGAAVYVAKKMFYINHPDYNLHPAVKLDLSYSVFRKNLFEELPSMLDDGLVISNPFIIAAVILLITVYLVKKHKILFVLLLWLVITINLPILAMVRTLEAFSNSVLYGELRQFLFLPYSILLLISLYVSDKKDDKESMDKKTIGVALISVLFALVLIQKRFLFDRELEAYNGGIREQVEGIQVAVKDALLLVEALERLAIEIDADVLIAADDRSYSTYVYDALYHDGERIAYTPLKDKRTWIYESLKELNNVRVLVYNEDTMEFFTGDTGDKSVIEYLSDLGLERRMESSSRMLQFIP